VRSTTFTKAAMALAGCDAMQERAYLMSGGPEAEARRAGPTPEREAMVAEVGQRMTAVIGVTGPSGSILRRVQTSRDAVSLDHSLPFLEADLDEDAQAEAVRLFSWRLNWEFCNSGDGNPYYLLGGILSVNGVNSSGRVIEGRTLTSCRD